MTRTPERLLITQRGAILPFPSAPSLASLLVNGSCCGSAAAAPLLAPHVPERRLPRARPGVGSCTLLHWSWLRWRFYICCALLEVEGAAPGGGRLVAAEPLPCQAPA